MSTAIFAPHVNTVLRIADTALVLGQRLSEWCGHGPVLEEDIALANIALDQIGQARLLLTHAAELDGRGYDEDRLAFLRPQSDYLNLTIVELPNGDFAQTMLRVFLVAAYQRELYGELTTSRDTQLAAIAAKSLKESTYHRQHAADWTVRLGDGTDESHRRAQQALDVLWPYTAEFFVPTDDDDDTSPVVLERRWNSAVLPVLEVATLKVPARTPFASRGKFGVHSEHLGHLLAEMQYLQRTYPGATW